MSHPSKQSPNPDKPQQPKQQTGPTKAETHFILSAVDPKLLDVTNKGIVALSGQPKELFTFGNDFYILDRSGTLIRTNALSSFRLCGTNSLLSDVATTMANKYTVLALKTDGTLHALGSDDIKIGILGLGSSVKRSTTFQQLVIEDKIRCASLADTYAVALADTGELYIWGTTQEKFFGDGISTTHFLPTKLTFSAELSIHRIFAHSEALFLLLDSNEIECITRFYSDNKSTASGYRLPKISEGKVTAVSPFGRFVALLTATGSMFVYHHQCRELSYLGEGFNQMSGSKNTLVAFEPSNHRLHVLSVPIYTNVTLSSLQRRVIGLFHCSAELLLHQPRLDTSILLVDAIKLSQERFQAVIAQEVPVSGAKLSDNTGKNLTLVACGVNSKTVLFEESYIRMRYKEIRELKRQEDKMRASGFDYQRCAKDRTEGEIEIRSEYSRDTNTRFKDERGRSKKSSCDDISGSLPAGVKHVSSGPLQAVHEHHLVVEGSRSDPRAELARAEGRLDSDFEEVSNYSQTGRSRSRGSNKLRSRLEQADSQKMRGLQGGNVDSSIFDTYHHRYFSKKFHEHKKQEYYAESQQSNLDISDVHHSSSRMDDIQSRLYNRKHSQQLSYVGSRDVDLVKHQSESADRQVSLLSHGNLASNLQSLQHRRAESKALTAAAILISERPEQVHSESHILTVCHEGGQNHKNITQTSGPFEKKMSREELEKYKRSTNKKPVDRERMLSKESLKSKSHSSQDSLHRRSQERFNTGPVDQPKVEKNTSSKQLHQIPSTGALGSRNSFNFSLSHNNSPSAPFSNNLGQLRDQLHQEHRRMADLGVTRAPLNSTECLTMSISSIGGTLPMASTQHNLLKSPTEGEYNQQDHTLGTIQGAEGLQSAFASEQNVHSDTNLRRGMHGDLVQSGDSLPIRSLSQSQGPTPDVLIKDLNIRSRLVSEFAILESLAEEPDESSTVNAGASKKESSSRIGGSGHHQIPLKQASKELSGLDDLYSPDPTHRETDRNHNGKQLSFRDDMADKGYEIGAYGIPEYKKSSGTATPFRDYEGSSNAPGSSSNDINRTIKGETPLMTAYQVISNTNSQSKDLHVDTLPPFTKNAQVMVTHFQQPSTEQSQIELQLPNCASATAVAGGLEALSPHLKMALQTDPAFMPNSKVATPYGSQTVHHSSSPGLLNKAIQGVDQNTSGVKGAPKSSKDLQSPKNKTILHKADESGSLGQSQSQPNGMFVTAMFGGPHSLLDQIQQTHSSISSKTSQNNSLKRVEIKGQHGWEVADENGDRIPEDNPSMPTDTIHGHNSLTLVAAAEAGVLKTSSTEHKNRHKGGSCCAAQPAFPSTESQGPKRTGSPHSRLQSDFDPDGPQMVPETGYYDPTRRRTYQNKYLQDSRDKSMVSAHSRDSSMNSQNNRGLNRSKDQKSIEPPPYQQRVLPKPPAEIPYRNSLNKLKGLCNKDSIDRAGSRSRSGGARSSAASGGSRHNSVDISFNFIKNSRAAKIISRTDDSVFRSKSPLDGKHEVEEINLDSKLNSPTAILNSVKKMVSPSFVGSRSQSRKKNESKFEENSSGSRTAGNRTPVGHTSPISSAQKNSKIEVAKQTITNLSASKKKMSILRAHAKKTIQEAKQKETQAKKATEESLMSKSGYYIPEGMSVDPTGIRLRSPQSQHMHSHIQHSHHTNSMMSASMHQHPAKDLVRVWQAVYMRKIRDRFARIVEMRERRKTIRTLQTVMDLKADLKRLKTQISSKTSVISSAEKQSHKDNKSFDTESHVGNKTDNLSRSNLNNSALNRSGHSSKDKKPLNSIAAISPKRDTPSSKDASKKAASREPAGGSAKKGGSATTASKVGSAGLRIDTSGHGAGEGSAQRGKSNSGVKSALLEHFNSVSNIATKPAAPAAPALPASATKSAPLSSLFGWEDLHLQKKYYEPGAFKMCILQDD